MVRLERSVLATLLVVAGLAVVTSSAAKTPFPARDADLSLDLEAIGGSVCLIEPARGEADDDCAVMRARFDPESMTLDSGQLLRGLALIDFHGDPVLVVVTSTPRGETIATLNHAKRFGDDFSRGMARGDDLDGKASLEGSRRDLTGKHFRWVGWYERTGEGRKHARVYAHLSEDEITTFMLLGKSKSAVRRTAEAVMPSLTPGPGFEKLRRDPPLMERLGFFLGLFGMLGLIVFLIFRGLRGPRQRRPPPHAGYPQAYPHHPPGHPWPPQGGHPGQWNPGHGPYTS